MTDERATLLVGGLIIDGTGAPPIVDGTVRFEDGLITAVGRRDDFGATGGAGAEVVDVTGRTVMPGLINCHEHLDNKYGTDTFQARAGQPNAYLVARAVRNALLDLSEGVTTIRWFAYKHLNHLAVRDAIEQGMILGPRVVTGGPAISMTGGHGWEISIEADGPDAVRRATRDLLKQGVECIKLMASGGFVTEGRDMPWSSQFELDELRAAFEEAHKAGRLTTVHCHPPKAIQQAIEAGVDCVEHGGLIDQETAALMADRGIWLVPTLGESWMVVHHGVELGQPEWLIEASRRTLTERATRFGYAVEAGVKIAVGTDAWPSIATEIRLMCEYGMNAMDALVAATSHGAQVCGLGDKTGTLEPGKWADVIVLGGNPLEDIGAISAVETTYKGGKRYRPAELYPAIGRFPL